MKDRRKDWQYAEVGAHAALPYDLADLRRILEQAKDEKPLQEYLTKHSVLVPRVLGFGRSARWVFPKLRLGAEFIPDFAVVDIVTSGYQWHLVELESPTFRVFTKAGDPTREFRHAEQQLNNWRIWLRQNVAYAQKQGWEGLDDTFIGVIVMGRRAEIDESMRDRYRELGLGRTTLVSYDRFLD